MRAHQVDPTHECFPPSCMQVDAGERAARAEAELRVLQARLREEQAACDALKKQMGEAACVLLA